MDSRNDRFNESMLSLDRMASGIADLSKSRMFNDHGRGAAAIHSAADSALLRFPRNRRREKLASAVWHLRRIGKRKLVPTLLLIFRYGSERQYSIEDLAAKRCLEYHSAETLYFSHRKQLNFEFLCKPCTEI